MRKKRLLKFNGLTLTELIIVISIIAFLILLAIAIFRSQIFKGNDAKRKADIHKIQVAVEEYEKDHDCYPEPQLVTCNPGDGLAPYISSVPCDPVSKASYHYDYDDAACPSWYRIYADLENEDDPDLLTSCGPGNTYNYYSGSPNAPPCNLIETNDYFGCKSGMCVPIYWDQSRPGPECDPNFQNPTCLGQCGAPNRECQPWNQ